MEQEEIKPRRLYWPQLDGLRFFAALLVIIHHAPLPPGMPLRLKHAGWAGVNLFLVLSAYLLARLLREEVETTSKIRLGKYFARRVLRIWPLYLGFVTVDLCYTIYTGHFSAHALGVWLSHMAFFNNFVTAWFGYEANLPFTPHLWTISLEEQFYLAIPFVLPVLMKQPTRRVVVLLMSCLSFLMIARVACVLLSIKHPFIWTLPLRGDAFVLGVGFALGAFDRLYHSVSGNSWFFTGFLLFIGSHFFGTPDLMRWKTVLLYTVTDIACLLMVMGCMKGTLMNGVFCTRPLRYLGKISFGLYVYHVVSIRIAGSLLGEWELQRHGWWEFVLSLLVTFVLSALSYEMYEKWFLRFKHRFEVVLSRPN